MEEVARDYISFARQLSLNGCYSRAFDLYLLAFHKNPHLKTVYEPEFRKDLTKLNEILAVGGKIEDIFTNFGKALNAFPENAHLLNDIGKYLYKFGFYTEAWCHFQKALKADSGFVNPEKNLNSVKNLLVERWHFRMLNDKIRNEAYRAAIKETIVSYKDSVLDLGTGTGLLAIYATECSPAALTACDGSKVMAKMAEAILHDNGKQEVIVVNSLSTNMDYKDIGGKRSLLITELFDAGLFGEHILKCLSSAKENLLIPEVARVVPSKGEFFVMGANSNQLNLKYQLSAAAKSVLNIPTWNVNVELQGDTYDCEDVHLIKDLKYLTEAQSLVKVDFNDHNDIKDLLNEKSYQIELRALEKGEINIIIGWFNLYLSENVTITTDPRSEDRANAWQQAVFFDKLPEKVEENQIVNVEFIMNGGKLAMQPPNDNMTRISQDVLRFLNDSDYINLIRKCIGIASVYLGQIVQLSGIKVIDFCPFPFFGLLMLKRGIESVTCCAKTECDKEFLKRVFEANGIPLSKVNILSGNKWSREVFTDEKYHAIFCNIFDMCGDVDLGTRETAKYLKRAHLVQGGLMMPSKLTMFGQIVSSHWLDINNRIYDSNVSDFKIAQHLNKYQVSQNFYIDFNCIEYTALSDPIELGDYSNGLRSDVVNVPVTKDGDANAILCWFEIEVMQDLGEITTKRSNCFMDGAVFLANPQVPMVKGEIANILRCVDTDGAFKLMIDVEAGDP